MKSKDGTSEAVSRRLFAQLLSGLPWAASLATAQAAGQTGRAPSQESLPPRHPEDFFFAIIADPQLGHHAMSDDVRQESATFEFTIQTLNRWRPAFTVICGDMTNRPENDVQLREYKRILAMLDAAIPAYHVAGNHDVTDLRVADDSTLFGSPNPRLINWYRNSYGPDYFSFRYRMFIGIVANSSYCHDPENVKDERAAHDRWLRAALVDAKRNEVPNIAVFQHWPFFVDDIAEPEGYLNLPKVERGRLLDMYREYGVKKVYSGHLHKNVIHSANDIELVTTSACGARLGQNANHGIRIVYIRNEKIYDEFFSLGDAPHLIRL